MYFLLLLQSAIGSVASAAEQAFVPYAERVLELMKVFMVLTNDEDLLSRARATELVGIVAMSVGRTRMEPVLPPFIEAAISVRNFISSHIWDCFQIYKQFLIGCGAIRVLVWSLASFGNTLMVSLAILRKF